MFSDKGGPEKDEKATSGQVLDENETAEGFFGKWKRKLGDFFTVPHYAKK